MQLKTFFPVHFFFLRTESVYHSSLFSSWGGGRELMVLERYTYRKLRDVHDRKNCTTNFCAAIFNHGRNHDRKSWGDPTCCKPSLIPFSPPPPFLLRSGFLYFSCFFLRFFLCFFILKITFTTLLLSVIHSFSFEISYWSPMFIAFCRVYGLYYILSLY